jgi:Protein of unknown function (DUF1501)
MTVHSLVHVRTSGDGVVSRRTFLRGAVAGAAGLGVLGFQEAMLSQAAELRKRGMSCILMFMRGGPSQFETFDPKPGSRNGGPTKAIDTAVSGIQVAEHWPNVAKAMKDIAIVRSMTNREGEHQRATYQLHTGYPPAGGLKHPTFGALAAAELGPQDFDLPHFVTIGGRGSGLGSSFLGMRYAPFVVGNPSQMPANVQLPRSINEKRFGRRIDLLKDLEEDFSKSGGEKLVEDHRNLYEGASQMVLSPRMKAFDLSQEKEASRSRFGRSSFGQGCLLARRLVEAGVTFIEIDSNGWDTHQDNFNRVKTLSQTVDPAFAVLVTELKEHGLLEKTLVVWMGEFGRTPRVNGNTGRDHWPRCFNVALAGGGIKGGQVLGSTSSDGTGVRERPVTVADLFCTFCHSLKINPRKENISSEGRPLKIVDGGSPVKELF